MPRPGPEHSRCQPCPSPGRGWQSSVAAAPGPDPIPIPAAAAAEFGALLAVLCTPSPRSRWDPGANVAGQGCRAGMGTWSSLQGGNEHPEVPRLPFPTEIHGIQCKHPPQLRVIPPKLSPSFAHTSPRAHGKGKRHKRKGKTQFLSFGSLRLLEFIFLPHQNEQRNSEILL